MTGREFPDGPAVPVAIVPSLAEAELMCRTLRRQQPRGVTSDFPGRVGPFGAAR
jgi:hypothetical protein